MDRPDKSACVSGASRGSSASVGAMAAARELNDGLGGLHELLKQLVELADQKLAGMRAADTAALQACAAREAEVLEELARSDQERQATLARLAQALQIPKSARGCLSEITARIPEPLASALRARRLALREIAAQLQRKNKLAAGVAHNLQAHIRAVFAEVAKANQESVVYGPQGRHEQAGVLSWLDAVG